MSRGFAEKYGPWALVAGASEGLGAEFARQIAQRGVNVVLLARQADKIEALAQRLRADHAVQARVLSMDLSATDLGQRVEEATRDIEVGLLVYNAAYSLIGPFLSQDLTEKLRIIDVNCRGPVVLLHVFGQPMARRGRGGILLMTSLAAAQGSPLIATYAATKAFNLVLAESLWDELRGKGVDVLGCRAGATRTPAYQASRPRVDPPVTVMEPEAVVRDALSALGRGPSTVPGWQNRMSAFLMNRVLPRRLAVRIMGAASRRMYGE